jgi:hypothetical protein
MPDSVTQILRSGPPGTKINIAVVGDGFAAGDQAAYNAKVQDLIINGVFGNDYFYEDASAFNVFRVNLISHDSGVSQRVYDEHGTPSDASDDTITSTTLRDTALGYIYSGSWAHCWMEGGANTGTLVNDALDTWVPDWDLAVVILNEGGFGGCGGGGFQVVTMGSTWAVMAHEFGHGAGGLADEYCQPGTFTGGEPGAVNVTANSNRTTLKWRQYVDPSTPVPTGINPNPGNGICTGWNQGPQPADWDGSQSAGLFEGAQYVDSGKYRPVINCRMRGNSPPYCPVCYTEMKSKHHLASGHSFAHVYTGDFSGDGKDDILIHNGNSILVYRSDGTRFELVFSAVERVPGSWQFQPGDQFYIGDFNGDGKDEVVVYNSTNWAMEYLGLRLDDAGLADAAGRPALRRGLRRVGTRGPLGVQRLGLVLPLPGSAAFERNVVVDGPAVRRAATRVAAEAERPAVRRRLRRRRANRPLCLQRGGLEDGAARDVQVASGLALSGEPLRRHGARLADAPSRPPLGRGHR